jgi:predicted kinase
MRMLYIIRGLPGSGKTTLAEMLNAVVCEADQFFMSEGEYKYNPEFIGEAHTWCKAKVENAMRDGYNCIAVSNTFTQRWEMEPYYKLAMQYAYEITEITLSGNLHENIHNVPEDKIKAMYERWER